MLAQGTMVDDVATRLEQQQVVKGLQQDAAIGLTHVDALSLHAPAFKAEVNPGVHIWLPRHSQEQLADT